MSYPRLTDDMHTVYVSFVLGKARVAPLKQVTIPRLEVEFFHRKSGPWIHSLHFTHVLALTPLDAKSAGFCLVLMNLHCVTSVFSLITEILFDKCAFSFAMYFSTD